MRFKCTKRDHDVDVMIVSFCVENLSQASVLQSINTVYGG